MSKEKPKYQALGKRIKELEKEKKKRQRVEEVLISTKTWLEHLITSSPVVFYSCKPSGDYGATFVSENVKTQLGYEPREFIEKLKFWSDNIHPYDRPQVFANLKRLFEQGKHTHEYRFKHKDGNYRWMLDDLQLVRDKKGKPLEIVGYWLDITERKQAEEALREEKDRAQRYRDVAGVMLVAMDADGKVGLINRKGCEILGYNETEVIGKNWFEHFLPQKHRKKVRKVFDKLMSGEIEPVEYYENPVLTSSGKERIIAWNNTLLRDDEGSILGILSSGDDITKQKQAEEALQISEERFRNIAEETDDWIWEIGQDLVFKYSNASVKEILGYEPEEIVGKSFFYFMPIREINHVDPKKEYSMLKEGIFTGQETYMIHKDGKTVITESSGIPIFRRDRTFVGFQGLTRDITEHVLAKQEEERHRQQLIQADKMISLGILVSGVAHEINNPNQFIIINAPMLKQAWENITPILDKFYDENGDFSLGGVSYTEMRDRIPKLFSEIYKGSKRIKHIVRNLKDYAREDSSEITQEVDINSVLESALTILSNLLKKSTKNLKVNYAENLPTIKGNFQRIEQVLINLIQNACNALPDPMKGIIITTSHNKKTRKIVVKIKDEGVGIPDHQMKYILDPFFTLKRDSGGTGLGLSISAGIIEDHGGRLEFSSEPGKGTTVSVIFPALHHPTS